MQISRPQRAASLFILIILCSCSMSTPLLMTDPRQLEPVVPAARTSASVAVRMNPQRIKAPVFRTTSVVALNSVALSVPSLRAMSADEPFVALRGSEFTAGAACNVTPLDNVAEVVSTWVPGQPLGDDDLSYALYEFTLPVAFAGESTCGVTWLADNQPADATDAWVGLSNWGKGTWDWYECPADQIITVASLPAYTRPVDGQLLVVVVLTGDQTCLLDRVSIGEPELRATGDEVILDAPPNFPPFYVPKATSDVLPAAIDLSPGCAEISDQGTWGSCTCFAVGDGAFNFELNRLYTEQGWDLTDAFNKVSPKYLYVESGKQQGFPPDPDYGRWTDEVIEGLRTDGVATLHNAPYDLIYNDNWSQDALDDAEQLQVAKWLPIPCNGASGIQNVKTVLANYEQPLVMRINLDYWFMYYEPDTVWNFIGPSYGGHAMLIVGYDDAKQAFKVRNSWSADWGGQGYVWIGYSTFSNSWAYVRCWTLYCDYNEATALRFTGQSATLPPPTAVDAADGTAEDTIAVQWVKSNGADGYRVYRDNLQTVVTELGDVDTWTDQGVQDEYSHMYWVTAVAGAQESAFGAPDLGFLAQAPSIEYLTPSSGREHRTATFIGAVYGSPPIDYSWDFGGAATPNTSDAAVPEVTLNGIGNYNVELTVSSPFGSDTLQIPFTVYPGNPPLPDLEVDKASGRTPLLVNFDASGSYDPDGAIVEYAWDFDHDGTYDLTTQNPQVAHTYTEVGSTTCVLKITDNSGLSDTIGRNISVLSTDNILPQLWWAGDVLGPPPVTKTFNVWSAYDPDGEIVNYEFDLDGDGTYEHSGMAYAVSHTYTEHATLTIKCRVTDNEGGIKEQQAQLVVGNGGVVNGWQVHAIDDFASNQNVEARATVAEGKPVVLVWEDDNGYLYSYHSSLAQPDSTDDWTKHVVEDTQFVNNSIAIAECNGAAVICFHDGDGLVYARYNGTTWDDHVVAADSGRLSIANVNGVPCIAYFDGIQLKYARATNATPASSGDWVIMNVSSANDTGGQISLQAVGGYPMIGFGQRDPGVMLAFARASVAAPSSDTDWSWHFIETNTSTSDSIAVGTINGLPAVVYASRASTNKLMLARANSATPGDIADWTKYVIDTRTMIDATHLNYFSGLPAIGYFGGDGWAQVSLAEATTADPVAAGDWTIERFDSRTTFFDLLNVAEQPALIYSNDDTFTLYYYYRVP